MAKFNIEVELDWLNENPDESYNLDEQLQKSIACQITNKITKTQSEKIDRLVNKELNKVFNKSIDKKMNELIKKWLNGDVIKVIDNWGDIKEEYLNIKDMLKKRFDIMLTEMVDGRGNKASYPSDEKMSRLEYIFKSFGKEQLDEKIKKTIEDVTIKLEKTVEEKIKEHVGKSVFEHAGLSKLIRQTYKTIDHKA